MTKTDVWMPFYIGDYLKDTMHLPREDHGSYVLLMLAYWSNQGPLKDDDAMLAGTAKVSLKLWLSKVRPRMLEFFRIENGCWRHKRIDSELEISRQRSEKASASANKRWQSQGNANAPANALRTECSSHSQYTHTPEVAWPAWDEWWFYLQKGGVAEWKARDEWNKQESKRWAGIEKWQSHADRVKAWWEADGRPAQPRVTNAKPKYNTGVDRNAGTANEGRAKDYAKLRPKV